MLPASNTSPPPTDTGAATVPAFGDPTAAEAAPAASAGGGSDAAQESAGATACAPAGAGGHDSVPPFDPLAATSDESLPAMSAVIVGSASTCPARAAATPEISVPSADDAVAMLGTTIAALATTGTRATTATTPRALPRRPTRCR